MASNPRSILVITGPTGIGKTDLAMRLADDSPLRIISADSVMIYRHLNIGSAKPSASELERYPHDLIDLVEPENPFDVGQYLLHAKRSIQDAWQRNEVPCLVGGTILYLKSLLDGLDALPKADPDIRKRIREKAEQQGWPAIHDWLKSLDPGAAEMIHPNHSSRLERALEVRLKTGESIRSFWTEGPSELKIGDQKANLAVLALMPADREKLKERLNRRFDSMLDRGFVDEVQLLRTRSGLTNACPSMRSVGYRQIWQYLDREISETEMREQAQAATRQLAKRQLTWLRSWRADTNTLIKVSDSLPITEGKTWLSKVFDRVL